MERITDKLLNFASILEPKTKSQACETAAMPFIYPHMALMPDAHLGMGATVGSVIPTKGAIMPSAIGVDIGCGMDAVRTPYTKTDIDHMIYDGNDLRDLHKAIASAIPLSAGARNQTLTRSAKVRIAELDLPGIDQAEETGVDWRSQLGSLGSGNHFIELSYDEDDRVWAFLHSGSRGIGNKLATKHIRIAKDQNEHDGVKLPNKDLAYLEEGSPGFDRYMEALVWAQHWAKLNRAEMMDRVLDRFAYWINPVYSFDIPRMIEISCHHNYTSREVWGGEPVWLSRKGAILAAQDVWGLIPGSMGTRSYVVLGKGNSDALNSAPHGAGRMFSRSAAKAQFTREDLNARMHGIVWGESDAFLDEHPQAYKDIDVVMADAADLVEVRHELRQFLNVKGQ